MMKEKGGGGRDADTNHCRYKPSRHTIHRAKLTFTMSTPGRYYLVFKASHFTTFHDASTGREKFIDLIKAKVALAASSVITTEAVNLPFSMRGKRSVHEPSNAGTVGIIASTLTIIVCYVLLMGCIGARHVLRVKQRGGQGARGGVGVATTEHQGGVSVAQGGVSVAREKNENDGEEMAEMSVSTSAPRGHFGEQRTDRIAAARADLETMHVFGGEAAGRGIDHTTVTFRNPMRKKETEVI